jgi:hypothetical protein
MERKKQLDQAAEKLADLLGQHLAELPPAEREIRSRAFDRAVSKVGTRAKSQAPAKNAPTRLDSGVTHNLHELLFRC